MFLRWERPEKDDYGGLKKNLVGKKNTDVRIKFFTIFQEITRYTSFSRHSYKNSENFFAYSCISEHSERILFFPHKNLHFLSGQGFAVVYGLHVR